MQFTLKNLKQCDGTDGPAYSATLYADGKRVGTVHNDGRGGSVLVQIADRTTRAAWQAAVDAAHGEKEYCREDSYVEDLLEAAEFERAARANARKGYPLTVVLYAKPTWFDAADKAAGRPCNYYADVSTCGARDEAAVEKVLARFAPAKHLVVRAS